jgi:hypothetical protein
MAIIKRADWILPAHPWIVLTMALPTSRRLIVVLIASLVLLAQTTFVPADFKVPQKVVRAKYQLVPLGPALARHDFDAYMGSIEHIRSSFGSGKWPTPDVTMADAIKDVEGEQERFQARRAFTYAVLSPDGKQELGCVYIQPSKDPAYDAQVRMWTIRTAFEAGLQTQMEKDARDWLKKDWPFRRVLYKNK